MTKSSYKGYAQKDLIDDLIKMVESIDVTNAEPPLLKSNSSISQHIAAIRDTKIVFDSLDVLICVMLAVFVWVAGRFVCACCCRHRRKREKKQEFSINIVGIDPVPDDYGNEGDDSCGSNDGNANSVARYGNLESSPAPESSEKESEGKTCIDLKPSPQSSTQTPYSITLTKAELESLVFEAIKQHASCTMKNKEAISTPMAVLEKEGSSLKTNEDLSTTFHDKISGSKRLVDEFDISAQSPLKRSKTIPIHGEYVRVRFGTDEEAVALKVIPQPVQPPRGEKLVLLVRQGNQVQELVEESSILGPVAFSSTVDISTLGKQSKKHNEDGMVGQHKESKIPFQNLAQVDLMELEEEPFAEKVTPKQLEINAISRIEGKAKKAQMSFDVGSKNSSMAMQEDSFVGDKEDRSLHGLNYDMEKKMKPKETQAFPLRDTQDARMEVEENLDGGEKESMNEKVSATVGGTKEEFIAGSGDMAQSDDKTKLDHDTWEEENSIAFQEEKSVAIFEEELVDVSNASKPVSMETNGLFSKSNPWEESFTNGKMAGENQEDPADDKLPEAESQDNNLSNQEDFPGLMEPSVRPRPANKYKPTIKKPATRGKDGTESSISDIGNSTGKSEKRNEKRNSCVEAKGAFKANSSEDHALSESTRHDPKHQSGTIQGSISDEDQGMDSLERSLMVLGNSIIDCLREPIQK